MSSSERRTSETQEQIAPEVYRDSDPSSGHPARLNLGDCFTRYQTTEASRSRTRVMILAGTDIMAAQK
jgi:uncharacterized protein with PIN domain